MVCWECGCPGWGWACTSIRQGLKDLDFMAKLPDQARSTSFHSPIFLLHSQGIALLLLTKGV